MRSDPGLFDTLKNQQSPDYMWIGCADSRVPANQIAGRLPGEIFVHRNVANQFVHSDFNALAVLQFAVDVLKVKNIVVCGHYGCGGVKAAMESERHGLVDNWLRPLKALAHRHREELAKFDTFEARFDALCEINVRRQVLHVTQTTVVEDAWARGQELNVHGAIYSVSNGVLTDLHTSVSSNEDVEKLEANKVLN
jgi:carbonic anhydrase